MIKAKVSSLKCVDEGGQLFVEFACGQFCY